MNKKEIIKGFILELTENDDFLMIQDWQNGYKSNEHEKMYPKLNKLAESLLRGLEASDKQVINDDMVITFKVVKGINMSNIIGQASWDKVKNWVDKDIEVIVRKVNPITKESM